MGTQVSRIGERLKGEGHEAEYIHFPDRSTEIGKLIDRFLRNQIEFPDESIHLLYSANRWELHGRMQQLLESGTTVVMDRYSYSGVVFTAAKGIDVDSCKAPEIGLIRPDLVLFLDLDPAAARARGGYGEERYEKEEFQRKVRAKYDEIWEERWVKVDAGADVEELTNTIYEHVIGAVRGIGDAPLERMW